MRRILLVDSYELTQAAIPCVPAHWRVGTVEVLYQQFFVETTPFGEEVANLELVESFCDQLPVSTFACFDWEGKTFPKVQKGDPASVAKFVELLQFAKAMRPDCNFACYGVGNHPYWLDPIPPSKTPKDWSTASDAQKAIAMQKWQNWLPVVEVSDWLAPTLYDTYAGELAGEAARSKAVVSSCCATGRRTLPYTWDRNKTARLATSEVVKNQYAPAIDNGGIGVVMFTALDKYETDIKARVEALCAVLP